MPGTQEQGHSMSQLAKPTLVAAPFAQKGRRQAGRCTARARKPGALPFPARVSPGPMPSPAERAGAGTGASQHDGPCSCLTEGRWPFASPDCYSIHALSSKATGKLCTLLQGSGCAAYMPGTCTCAPPATHSVRRGLRPNCAAIHDCKPCPQAPAAGTPHGALVTISAHLAAG